MAEYIQADVCPVCASPVFVKMVPGYMEPPPPQYTCRCRQVYPDVFTRPRPADELGYATGLRSKRRRAVH